MTVKMSTVLSDSTSVMEESKREIKKSPLMKKSEEETLKVSKKPSDSSRLHQKIKESPIVDKEKVEALKHKINTMEYAINPQRIADKILALENEIFNTPKLSEK